MSRSDCGSELLGLKLRLAVVFQFRLDSDGLGSFLIGPSTLVGGVSHLQIGLGNGLLFPQVGIIEAGEKLILGNHIILVHHQRD